MPKYKRWFQPGGTFFFTVITFDRQPILCEPQAREFLQQAIKKTQNERPFEIAGMVLLPDHLHTIWKLPENDDNFSTRWNLIKRRFTRNWLTVNSSKPVSSSRMAAKRERSVWQRRFWEHLIRDQQDMANHMDYIHYNPIKHGLVQCPHQWPWSSFPRYVKEGAYASDWLCSCSARKPPRPTFLDRIGGVGE